MNRNAKRNAPPAGWGAAEILRAMSEDARRFRRPGTPLSGGGTGDCDDAADTLRDPRRHGS